VSSEFLPVFLSNALAENAELVPQFGQLGLEGIRRVCDNYRIAGIAELLLTAAPGPLRHRLHQSGRAFAAFLRRSPDAGPPLSECRPLLDALAAGDWEGAREIAARARRTWDRGSEYEEDFLFLEWIASQLSTPPPPPADAGLLARWDACLEGSTDPRLGACRALAAGDAAAFDAALSTYLLERRDDVLERAEAETLSPETAATEPYFSVEGAALLRLADRRGLTTSRDYRTVPSQARDDAPLPFSTDSWTRPE
jgi:immunity protein 49 of polymorphic toxin system